MKEDMKNLNIFDAEILEEVPNKKNLLEVENKWIKHFDAVDSEEFYNKSYASVGPHNVDQNATYNIFGESIMEYGKATSSCNKRNGTAVKYGFENLGVFCIYIYKQHKQGKTWAEIARDLGWERHQPKRYISCYNMEKCIKESDEMSDDIVSSVRNLWAKGASVIKIAELLSLEIPTIFIGLGDYSKANQRTFLCASRRGLTKAELEVQLTKQFLEGKGFNQIGKEFGLDATSVKRYCYKCIRARLKINDL